MVVLMQGGLIQVYEVSDKLNLKYCKTLDTHEKKKLYGTGVEYEDEFFVPKLPRDQLRPRYKPQFQVKLPQFDLSVSTTGDERLALCLTASSRAKIYELKSGELQQKVQLQEGDSFLKLGIVQFESFSDFLYIVVKDICSNICGLMYHLKDRQFLWRLELHTILNYDFSVFSLFTKHGLLLFGREHSDSYPFTWLWRG